MSDMIEESGAKMVLATASHIREKALRQAVRDGSDEMRYAARDATREVRRRLSCARYTTSVRIAARGIYALHVIVMISSYGAHTSEH